MEKLKYVIEDDKIAELFGVQNFTNKESAILELVKNAYDAGASNLNIKFDNDSINFIDDGCGMSYETLKSRWTKIGNSSKEYEFLDENNQTRIYSGSKGIGRFALARLGAKIEMISKCENEQGVRWNTDWNDTTLEYIDYNIKGTKTTIKLLRDKWLKATIVKLYDFLSKTYNDDKMNIFIHFAGEIFTISKVFKNPLLGFNCFSIINLKYDKETTALTVNVKMDEFLDEAKVYCKDISLTEYNNTIFMKNEKFENIDVLDNELLKYLVELGSFEAELYFGFNPKNIDKDLFLYKYSSLSSKYNSGVILYRNAFSISSYEGNRDWLELGKRSRKSPAAATHPSGSWRVRENQLSGKVCIDKKQNPFLKDLANRQGLDENEHYKLFIQIIQKGLAIFERYRQSIIRLINTKNEVNIEEKNTKIIDTILKNPSKIQKLNDEELGNLVSELDSLKQYKEKLIIEKTANEERYKYDVRILNSLSTQGLRASAIAHEMQTDRDTISTTTQYIITRLIELNLWEILDKPENKKYAYNNVPDLLTKNESVNKKILRFMDTMLMSIEKSQFKVKLLNIKECLETIKINWQIDYSWININIIIEEGIEFLTTKDILNVIFDNLILNSVQQNDSKNNLNIIIEVKKQGNKLLFKYSDNGKGLHEKYLSDPWKILDVHESTRENGHGLGMWIINNSLNMTGGDILDITGTCGFKIEFELGDKL